jgi:hypothetical protein
MALVAKPEPSEGFPRRFTVSYLYGVLDREGRNRVLVEIEEIDGEAGEFVVRVAPGVRVESLAEHG